MPGRSMSTSRLIEEAFTNNLSGVTIMSSIQPPGDKMKKAIQEFSELLETKPEKSRRQLLERVAIKYDLSPNESAFLERHFSE